MSDPVVSHFGNRLRIRVCGICLQQDRILLVKHRSINPSGYFLSPPGGGLEYGESMQARLIQEFKEEVNFKIEVQKHLFINEFLAPPLHAIEHFFEVNLLAGELKKGSDPELSHSEQIIEDVAFYSLDDIRALPEDSYHPFFKNINTLSDLLALNSFTM